MGMHACRAIQAEAIRDLRGEPALERRGAGEDDGADARGACPRDHRVEVVVEARVREVRADVDELHAPSIASS
jgi:hypothetical protein